MLVKTLSANGFSGPMNLRRPGSGIATDQRDTVLTVPQWPGSRWLVFCFGSSLVALQLVERVRSDDQTWTSESLFISPGVSEEPKPQLSAHYILATWHAGCHSSSSLPRCSSLLWRPNAEKSMFTDLVAPTCSHPSIVTAKLATSRWPVMRLAKLRLIFPFQLGAKCSSLGSVDQTKPDAHDYD